MSTQKPNSSADQGNYKDTDEDSALEETVDVVEDLVMKGGYTGNPQEILDNPAVAPQMIDEPSDLRDDLRRD